MDVYISEEYVIKRRRERQMRVAADDGKRREVVSESAGEEKKPTNAWMAGFGREKGGKLVGAGTKEDIVFSCFSA